MTAPDPACIRSPGTDLDPLPNRDPDLTLSFLITGQYDNVLTYFCLKRQEQKKCRIGKGNDYSGSGSSKTKRSGSGWGRGGGEEPISLILPVQTAVLVHIGQVPDLAQHGHRQLRAQHHVPHLHTEQKVRFPRH